MRIVAKQKVLMDMSRLDEKIKVKQKYEEESYWD